MTVMLVTNLYVTTHLLFVSQVASNYLTLMFIVQYEDISFVSRKILINSTKRLLQVPELRKKYEYSL